MDIPLTHQPTGTKTLVERLMALPQALIAPSPNAVIRTVMVLNIILGYVLIVLSRQIFANSEFFNLGAGGRWFLTIATFVPLILAIVAFLALRQKNPLGRYLSLIMLYITFVLSVVGLLHTLGVFTSFSLMVDSILQNIMLAWLLPLAYALFWIGGRLDEKNAWRDILEQVGILLAIGVTILLLFSASFLNGVNSLIDTYGIFNGETIIPTSLYAPLLIISLAIAIALIAQNLNAKSELRALLQQANLLLVIGAGLVIVFNPNFLNGFTKTQAVWVLTIAAGLYGWFFWRMLKLGDYFGERPEQNAAWQGWLMLSPNIIGFMIFFAGPLLLSFYLSFTDATVGRIPNEIETANYQYALGLEFKVYDEVNPYALALIRHTQKHTDYAGMETLPLVRIQAQAFMSRTYTPLAIVPFKDLTGADLIIGAADRLFWLSLRNTLMFCFLMVILSTGPALGLALILNSKLPGMKIYRALYFLPSIAAVVGTALIWKWLYNPIIGFFNSWITSIVGFLNGTFGLQIADPKISWLTDPNFVLISMVLLSSWQVIGFNTVLFLAGLQGIPKELYEAAKVDGANYLGQLRNITIPMLAPTSLFVIITTVITGLQVFNEPYTLFTARPLPENAITSVFHLYNEGFFGFNFGYASAIAWVLFAVIFSITLLQFRVSRNNAYE